MGGGKTLGFMKGMRRNTSMDILMDLNVVVESLRNHVGRKNDRKGLRAT